MANPFIPTFGVSPNVFAGRAAVVDSFGRGLDGGVGDPRRILLLSGPRGIGKTVTLNELEDEAKRHGWVVLRAQPHSVVQPLIETEIPSLMSWLRDESSGKRRITGVTAAGWGFRSKIEHPHEVSPSLISALNELVDELGAGSGALITVDEVQAAYVQQLWELTAAIQDLMRDSRHVAFAAAGLPEGVSALLQHRGTTFLRRAQHVNLGVMSPEDTAGVLRDTAQQGGVEFTADALAQAVELCRGYPFLIQLVGFHLFEWAAARELVIGGEAVTAVTTDVLDTLGRLVHAPALTRVPARQTEFLQAMARVQDGNAAVKVGDIAATLGATLQSLSMARQGLLERELIYSPRRGYLNFTIPHMGYHLLKEGVRETGWD